MGWVIASNNLQKRFSIRRFITLPLLIAVIICTGISSYWVYKDAVHEVDELFDASLAQTSRVLHGMISRESIINNKQHLLASLSTKDHLIDKYSSEATPYGHRYEKKISFQVWSPQGELLLKSSSINAKQLAPFELGFHSVTANDQHWRTFTLYSEMDDYWLIVGERNDIREELIHEIARDHSLPVLISLPVLALLIRLTLSKGFSPLQKVSQQVDAKDYITLSSIKNAEVPEEVDGLVGAINNLFDRLTSSFKLEQQFVSNAAHELRNPLASMLVHTENMIVEAQKSADNTALLTSLQSVKTSAKRLSHLVQQLLTLSRADADFFSVDNDAVDLALLSSEVCNNVEKPESTQLEFDMPLGHFMVRGNANLLESMLRNLVDNAVRYSPAGSLIKIHCNQTRNGVELLIEDNGPGISDSDKERVLERFQRLENTTQQGSGLGLSIVYQIARLHGAQLELNNSDLGGLLVKIHFQNQSAQ